MPERSEEEISDDYWDAMERLEFLKKVDIGRYTDPEWLAVHQKSYHKAFFRFRDINREILGISRVNLGGS